MKKVCVFFASVVILLAGFLAVTGCTSTSANSASHVTTISVTDGYVRIVTVPLDTERIVCSGSGCLRYISYLGVQDKVVGVDSIEKKNQTPEGRAYAIANPQYSTLPLIGEYRGKDDPEKIIGIGPQVIFKTASLTEQPAASSLAADTLQNKTGIPVIGLPYGELGSPEGQAQVFSSLRTMGDITGKSERADELILYINATIADLENRTGNIPVDEQKSVYIGGVSFNGPHGIVSTEPAYPPFSMVHANNIAGKSGTQHADISKETLVSADPDYIFIDVGTLQMPDGGAITELRTNPAYSNLSAVEMGQVYGVLPYNFYSTNYESLLAEAYYIGKTVYPDRFSDIDPKVKADEIYTEFVGKPVSSSLNAGYNNSAFAPIEVT